ncbi:uncharacterized protein BBA_09075 [Beauveria bassiana ARSEF 2860]|uniref:Uncharacterized protein n=1 Tax=Beauveria bassiana (strain ARSEF 2860) TaxID=655819 RepID=J4UGK7_BEAB2|nr:uncharacterized protein BBA_09075 [Beauveria bassiana ARSEF 2860]EJP62027.1 hypothetical protein BBA_09075 [Beauveria bassiana ARSEF 2860]
MAAAAAHETETTEHEDGPRAPTPTSPYLPQGTACGAASGSQDEVILIPSDSESESDSEADEDVPSLKAMTALIDKETAAQPHSTSPASTMTTVPNTPRAVESGLEVDDDMNGALQHSTPPVSLTTSVSPRQEPGDGSKSSRCSPSLSAAEVAERDLGQVEDANESVSSHCDHHEADDRAELLRQTQPHESASQNVLASDADGHTTDVGDCNSSRDADSDSSGDSSGGSNGDGDGDDDEYDDDGSSRDTDEDDRHSKKRGTRRSPFVSSSDHGHADGPPNDHTEENPPRPHKRQKVAHDRADITPVRRQNSMTRSAGRLPQSPERPQTASMLSPPASHSLSESESDEGSDCSNASNERRGILAAGGESHDRTDESRATKEEVETQGMRRKAGDVALQPMESLEVGPGCPNMGLNVVAWAFGMDASDEAPETPQTTQDQVAPDHPSQRINTTTRSAVLLRYYDHKAYVMSWTSMPANQSYGTTVGIGRLFSGLNKAFFDRFVREAKVQDDGEAGLFGLWKAIPRPVDPEGKCEPFKVLVIRCKRALCNGQVSSLSTMRQ